MHGEGHLRKERLRFEHVVNTFSRKGDHQLMETLKVLQNRADQTERRPPEFLHQAGNQNGGGPFSESLAKQLRILQRQGVVVDGGDQTLLEIHSVISATT